MVRILGRNKFKESSYKVRKMNKKIKDFFKLGFVLAVVHFLWHTSVKDIKEDQLQ